MAIARLLFFFPVLLLYTRYSDMASVASAALQKAYSAREIEKEEFVVLL